MAPKQVRLDRLWKLPAVPDEVLAIKAAAGKVDVAAATKEVELEVATKDVDGQFAANGSRDRYGHLRKNIGGRPKKIHTPESPSTSNRRQPGLSRRREFGAQEKLQMIIKARRIEQQVKLKGPPLPHPRLTVIHMVSQVISHGFHSNPQEFPSNFTWFPK